MKMLYAVSSGSYSDYRVNAIFSSEKLANEFIKAIPDGDFNEIEIYILDPDTADLVRRGYGSYRVIMLRDGTVEDVTRYPIGTYSMDISHFIWKRTEAAAYRGKGIPDALNSNVLAKNEKQAIKIVNEKRTQMIANNEWK